MTLENLVQIGKLKPHKTTSKEIVKLLAAVRRNLSDSHNRDISPESRFDIAYKAAMQCALVAVMANGFRPSTNEPGHHATVIQSLPKTVGLSNDRVIVLDQLARKGISAITAAKTSAKKRPSPAYARRKTSPKSWSSGYMTTGLIC